jgi:hypothetical protein
MNVNNIFNGKSASASSSIASSGPDQKLGGSLMGKLREAGLDPKQVQSVMKDLASGGYQSKAALGDALESKLTSMGLSESKVSSILQSLNGGQAKGADSSADTSSSSGTSSSAASSSGDSSQLAARLEETLSKLGLSTGQIRDVLKALNGGAEKGASTSSAGKDYYTDSFTAS